MVLYRGSSGYGTYANQPADHLSPCLLKHSFNTQSLLKGALSNNKFAQTTVGVSEDRAMSDTEPGQKTPPRKRRWFQYSLRSLLVLTLIVAALSAWLGKHIMRASTQRPIVAKIAASGGTVGYDYQIHPEFNIVDQSQTAPGSKLVRWVFGDDIYATVNVVFLNDPKTSDADIVNLHKLPDLLDVSLNGRGVTDACIDDLLRIPKLRAVALMDTGITPEGIRHLSSCDALQSLTVLGSSVTDQHLQHLPAFPNLQHIQIVRSSMTDDGMNSLGQMDLATLDIFTAPAVTDKGFESLANLQNLLQLRVLRTAMTDRAMGTIGRFRKLRYLQLDNHSLTDSGLRNLSSLTELEKLQLGHTQLANDGLRALSNAKQLRYLDISGTLVTDDGIGHLGALPHLERIDLGNTSVTNVGLLKLAKLPSLKQVDVGINNGITMQGVDALKAARPSCVIVCWKFQPNGSGDHVARAIAPYWAIWYE